MRITIDSLINTAWKACQSEAIITPTCVYRLGTNFTKNGNFAKNSKQQTKHRIIVIITDMVTVHFLHLLYWPTLRVNS